MQPTKGQEQLSTNALVAIWFSYLLVPDSAAWALIIETLVYSLAFKHVAQHFADHTFT